jgi:hypothetical protein
MVAQSWRVKWAVKGLLVSLYAMRESIQNWERKITNRWMVDFFIFSYIIKEIPADNVIQRAIESRYNRPILKVN